MAKIESVVEPDGVADDIWGVTQVWESVAFISAHGAILSISVSLLGSTLS